MQAIITSAMNRLTGIKSFFSYTPNQTSMRLQGFTTLVSMRGVSIIKVGILIPRSLPI